MSTKELSPKELCLRAVFGEEGAKGLPEEGGPEDRILMERLAEFLKEKLTFREREIIMMRYGINDEGIVWRLEDVGRIFKITRERVRQIEAKAIRKLRGTQE